jgi:hypothetical protein
MLLSLGLVLGALLLAAPAHAQIARVKPGKVDAANRRALREANRTDAPYKDSHLEVPRERLKRGASDPQIPEGSDALRFKKGVAPNVKEGNIFGIRRKKKP